MREDAGGRDTEAMGKNAAIFRHHLSWSKRSMLEELVHMFYDLSSANCRAEHVLLLLGAMLLAPGDLCMFQGTHHPIHDGIYDTNRLEDDGFNIA